jgi:hypothetical protein
VPERRLDQNAEQRSDWVKILEVLRKSNSATVVEVCALSGIAQNKVEETVTDLQAHGLVTVLKKGGPLRDIVTIKEKALAASAS